MVNEGTVFSMYLHVEFWHSLKNVKKTGPSVSLTENISSIRCMEFCHFRQMEVNIMFLPRPCHVKENLIQNDKPQFLSDSKRMQMLRAI